MAEPTLDLTDPASARALMEAISGLVHDRNPGQTFAVVLVIGEVGREPDGTKVVERTRILANTPDGRAVKVLLCDVARQLEERHVD